MKQFYLEAPNINRKEDAIAYIKEFYKYKSAIQGTGGLQKFLDNYEGWLKQLQENCTIVPNEKRVPSRTYFLIRSNDNKIIGSINIRLTLNENLKKFGGHIGYSIRPTERNKGYNKINLYLGLKICQEYNIKIVFIDAAKDNPASWKTIEALNGVNIKEFFDNEHAHCIIKGYKIDVNKSLANNSALYEPLIKKSI